MRYTKWVGCLAMAAMAAVGVINEATSQQGPPPPWAPGGDPREMMEYFRKQAELRMKQLLGATDEEWQILQPRIDKVQTLQRASRGGMGMMMMRPGGPPGPGGQPGGPGGWGGPQGPRGGQPYGNQPPPSELEKKAADLLKTLDGKDSKADDVKAALAAYREARAKARVELEKAQKELKELLTIRQEARLVMMGLLE